MEKGIRLYSRIKMSRRFFQNKKVYYLSQSLLMPESELSGNVKTDLNNFKGLLQIEWVNFDEKWELSIGR